MSAHPSSEANPAPLPLRYTRCKNPPKNAVNRNAVHSYASTQPRIGVLCTTILTLKMGSKQHMDGTIITKAFTTYMARDDHKDSEPQRCQKASHSSGQRQPRQGTPNLWYHTDRGSAARLSQNGKAHTAREAAAAPDKQRAHSNGKQQLRNDNERRGRRCLRQRKASPKGLPHVHRIRYDPAGPPVPGLEAGDRVMQHLELTLRCG